MVANSLRSVRIVYEDQGTTFAAEIPARRLAKARALLTLCDESLNVAALAQPVGLTRDELTHAL